MAKAAKCRCFIDLLWEGSQDDEEDKADTREGPDAPAMLLIPPADGLALSTEEITQGQFKNKGIIPPLTNSHCDDRDITFNEKGSTRTDVYQEKRNCSGYSIVQNSFCSWAVLPLIPFS